MRIKLLLKLFLIAVALSAVNSPIHAKPLTIKITKGLEAAAPIAVVPFAAQGQRQPSQDVAQIVRTDLLRSGDFNPLAPGDMLSKPSDPQNIKYQNWRFLGMESLC
jgi:TolB protein